MKENIQIKTGYLYHIRFDEALDAWESISECTGTESHDKLDEIEFMFKDIEVIIGEEGDSIAWSSTLNDDRYTVIKLGYKDDLPEYYL